MLPGCWLEQRTCIPGEPSRTSWPPKFAGLEATGPCVLNECVRFPAASLGDGDRSSDRSRVRGVPFFKIACLHWESTLLLHRVVSGLYCSTVLIIKNLRLVRVLLRTVCRTTAYIKEHITMTQDPPGTQP